MPVNWLTANALAPKAAFFHTKHSGCFSKLKKLEPEGCSGASGLEMFFDLAHCIREFEPIHSTFA
jgi:hypothetical protein